MPPPIIKPDSYRIHTQGIAAVVNARCLGPSLSDVGSIRFKSADAGEWEMKVPEAFANFCKKDDMVVFSITLVRNSLGEAVFNEEPSA